jgi:hypothetical protein
MLQTGMQIELPSLFYIKKAEHHFKRQSLGAQNSMTQCYNCQRFDHNWAYSKRLKHVLSGGGAAVVNIRDGGV